MFLGLHENYSQAENAKGHQKLLPKSQKTHLFNSPNFSDDAIYFMLINWVDAEIHTHISDFGMDPTT